jgi:ATP-dependent DNA ligase
MLLLHVGALPEATEWLYELTLDGYRALCRCSKTVVLRYRMDLESRKLAEK